MSGAILICHRGALGDYILTWPALMHLKNSFPRHKLIGLGRNNYMNLAHKWEIIDEYYSSDSSRMNKFFNGGRRSNVG